MAERQYAAFVSYTHADRKWANWLHKRLEGYRIPKALAGRDSPVGPLGKRIGPVFIDRAEIAATGDLSKAVSTALVNSNALVVVCSRRAVGSKWVNEEIRRFKALGRTDRIFCLIVDGSPNATTRPERDDALECYPASLRLQVDEAGDLTPFAAREVLGADVRPGQDNRRAAITKLIAGIADLPLAEVSRRDQQRFQQQLIAATVVSVSLLAVMAAMLTVAVISRQQAEEQRNVAQVEARRAKETAKFLKSLFRVVDPGVARGNTITAREILDRGVDRIEEDLNSQPEVRFSLQTTLGEVYTNLGLYEQADELLSRAYATSQSLAGDDPEMTRGVLARAEVVYLRGDYELAEKLFQEAWIMDDQRSHLALDERVRLSVGLGELFIQLERDDEAETLLMETLELVQGIEDVDEAMLGRTLAGLGTLKYFSGDGAAAEDFFRRTLSAYWDAYGQDHPKIGEALNQLGSALYMQGDYAAAEKVWNSAVPIVTRVYGPDHPELAGLLNNIGRLQLAAGDYEGAIRQFENIIRIDLQQKPEDHDDFAYTFNSLGLAQLASGRCEGARESLYRALTIADKHEHEMQGVVLVNLAQLHCELAEWEAAEGYLDQAGAVLKDTFGAEHWRVHWHHNTMGACLWRKERSPEARDMVLRSSQALIERWQGQLFGANAVRHLVAVGEQAPEINGAELAPWEGCAR